MKNREKIEGIIGIIDDGIKDACMQMDWAEEARERGEKEVAAMFQSEAGKRAAGAREWYDKNRDALLASENAEAVAAVFVHRMGDRLSEVITKLGMMK